MTLLAGILPYIGIALAFVGTFVGAYFAGHSKGKAKAEATAAVDNATISGAQSTAAVEAKLNAEKDAQNVQNSTSTLDNNAIADRMQQYTRPDDSGKV